MSDIIDKRQCVFLAPLDPVLRQSPARYDSLLRFFALLNPHVVVTDTQVLDNALFQRGPMRQNLGVLFGADSGVDEFPLFLVSQRRADCNLLEVLAVEMARAGRPAAAPPMRFSSLTHAQRARLQSLWKQGRLTERALEREVGYDVKFASRLSKLVSSANYAGQCVWPPDVSDSRTYYELLFKVLACKSLHRQAGIRGRAAKSLMNRLVDALKKRGPHNFSRTTVYDWLDGDAIRIASAFARKTKNPVKPEELSATIRAVADYAYLRNFSDRSGYTFLLDDTHWLASSVVNDELQAVRPAAEAADDLVEECLDLQETREPGTSRQMGLRLLLNACGFERHGDWKRVLKLRQTAAFADRLRSIERSTSIAETAELLRDHVKSCLSTILKKHFHAENFVVNLALGGIGLAGAIATSGTIAQAALGIATAGGGWALYLGGKHIIDAGKQAFLIDQVANSVVSEFARRPSESTTPN